VSGIDAWLRTASAARQSSYVAPPRPGYTCSAPLECALAHWKVSLTHGSCVGCCHGTCAASRGGKFLYRGDQICYVRSVTYGPFRPDADGGGYHSADVVERDVVRMAANGLNAVRTYTVPPRWLLDAAHSGPADYHAPVFPRVLPLRPAVPLSALSHCGSPLD
jgi:hypothetical protein